MSHQLKSLKRLVFFIIILGLPLVLIHHADAQHSNSRGDQLVLVTLDRGGGATSILNGRGDQAFVTMNWYESKTLTNARGEILETGAFVISVKNSVNLWESY